MFPDKYRDEEEDYNLQDTKETSEIFGNNDSKNYYREALEKQYNNQITEELSETSEDKENFDSENVPTIENMQEEPLPTAHFGKPQKQIVKKKGKQTKTAVSEGRKTYQFLK